MAGTLAGGKAAGITNKLRHGDDYYKRIGAIGGKKGHTGGFATKTVCRCDEFSQPHYRSECAGSRGGRISRRSKA